MNPLHYSAFTTSSGGGNPAGVVLDASAISEDEMRNIAARLGYSETAFLIPELESSFRIRYFSPEAEVDFCGHATVAAVAALADHTGLMGDLLLHTNVGQVPVALQSDGGATTVTLCSVEPRTRPLASLETLLELLGWGPEDLDQTLPAGLAFAGLWHPIVWAKSRERLAALDYDFDGLRELMLDEGWGTVSLLYRETAAVIHSRNAFPIGGVVEDPATGAAAAALGGYLRAHALVPDDRTVTVLQGEDMGQPCSIQITIPETGGILVTGTARQMTRSSTIRATGHGDRC